MWYGQIAAGVVGLCGGILAATALAAFISGLGILQRYAGVTRTAHCMLLYEDSVILGCILGNVISVYRMAIPLGGPGLAVTGLFFGIFLGSWIIALGEVVNVFSIMARRIGITKGVGLIVLTIAAGKMLGSFLQFFVL